MRTGQLRHLLQWHDNRATRFTSYLGITDQNPVAQISNVGETDDRIPFPGVGPRVGARTPVLDPGV